MENNEIPVLTQKPKPRVFNYQKHSEESDEEYLDRVLDESFVNMGWIKTVNE